MGTNSQVKRLFSSSTAMGILITVAILLAFNGAAYTFANTNIGIITWGASLALAYFGTWTKRWSAMLGFVLPLPILGIFTSLPINSEGLLLLTVTSASGALMGFKYPHLRERLVEIFRQV